METVYLFPLNQSLTLKKIPLPYHIFEPKYKDMINDALNNNKRVCVLPTQNDYSNKVCVAGIPVLLQKYEDGRMDIVITGVEKVLLNKEIQKEKLLEYTFEPIKENLKVQNKEDFDLIKEILYQRLKAQPNFDEQRDQFDKILQDNETVANYSNLLLLESIEEKYEVMTFNSIDKKIQYLIEKLSPEEIDIFEYLNFEKP